MIRFDQDTRQAIKEAVEKAVAETLLSYEEKWLTSEQVSEQFAMFSKDWMRRNAWRLPRDRFQMTDKDGKVSTRWAYPQHQIAKMIIDNRISL